MRLHARVDRTAASRRRSARKGLKPLEILEPRQLLTGTLQSGAAGFLQGYVYNSLNNPISGATVELLNSAGTSVLWTETTNPAGYYNFNDYPSLTAGTTYNIVTPDLATTSVGIQTTVNPASDNTSLPGYANAIKVTVEDLSAQSIGVNWNGSYEFADADSQLNASTYNLASPSENSGPGPVGSLRSRSAVTWETSPASILSARTCSMGSSRTRLSPFSPA